MRPSRLAFVVQTWLSALALALGACQGRSSSDAPFEVTIQLPADTQLSQRDVSFSPEGHVRALRQDESGLLQLQTDGTELRVHIPRLCPVRIPEAKQGQRSASLSAKRLFTVPAVLAQVGYDAAFSFDVVPGCPEAARAVLSWRQVEGLPLPPLTVEADGMRVRGRTLPLSAYFPDGVPDGIVPVSPRSQGRYVLTTHSSDPAAQRLQVVITSSARATGLSSIAVTQRLLLGGSGWRMVRTPHGSRAQLSEHATVTSFAPDLPGPFVLANAHGERLTLQASTHDLTPMDCGRPECHAAISSAAAASPMSRALELPFARGLADLSQQSCMLDCHVVGELGLDDGGYRAVAASFPYQPSAHGSVSQLPHALQRLAGVRCTSCHGPGAVPAKEGRSHILRASVCATCHDAPPAYTHVAEWNESAMARADAAPATRDDLRCAQCHTTGGFLHRSNVRRRDDLSRDPDQVGISCAACHAPHGEHLGRALVRKLAAPTLLRQSASLRESASGLCAQCHSPLPDQLSPAASSAALWSGQLELPAGLGGGTLAGSAAHAVIPGGCMGCHGKRSGNTDKIDHSFKVADESCVSCHQQAQSASWRAEKQVLTARASALAQALEAACGDPRISPTGIPRHAFSPDRPCASPALARARYAALLVREDGAAYEHNAGFARQLLDEAERALKKSQGAARSP